MPEDKHEGAEDLNMFQLGRVHERVDTVQRGLLTYQQSTDARFNRLEDRIMDGFRQSQQDREAGNKTLGDLIAQQSADVKAMSQVINRGQGALTMSDKIMGVVIVLGASALGGWLSHL